MDCPTYEDFVKASIQFKRIYFQKKKILYWTRDKMIVEIEHGNPAV